MLFQKTDPSTIVELDSILKQIKNSELGKHANDVDAMLTAIEGLCKILCYKHCAPETFCCLIRDELAMGPTHYLKEFIKSIEDDIESGIRANENIALDALITAARTKYNDMDQ